MIIDADWLESLHRLESAIELHVDQQRTAAVQTLGDEISRFVHGLRPLRPDAERPRQSDEIDLRVDELHADMNVDSAVQWVRADGDVMIEFLPKERRLGCR